AKLSADRLDRLTMNKIGATDLRNRLHHQHPNLGFHDLMEATVDPCPGSRLDADHPENGVLIPRRNTSITESNGGPVSCASAHPSLRKSRRPLHPRHLCGSVKIRGA